MAKTKEAGALSRRESEIMDILHQRGSATAAEVHEQLPEPAGYSSVRKLLEILEEKGLVRHEKEGRRYVYYPKAPDRARASAMQRLVRTFFGGSVERAAAALLESSNRVSESELTRILKLAEDADRRGR